MKGTVFNVVVFSLFSLFGLFGCSYFQAEQKAFVTQWVLPQGVTQLTLPLNPTNALDEPLDYELIIDWGDGSEPTHITPDNYEQARTHAYATAGEKTVSITSETDSIDLSGWWWEYTAAGGFTLRSNQH